MSFTVSIKNPPKGADTWLPVVYYRDPETGAYTPYFPEDSLNINMDWLCPLSAGSGIIVDLRAVVYDASNNVLDTKDIDNTIVRDGQTYEIDWGGEVKKSMVPWVVGAFVGGVVVTALATRKKK